LDLIAAGTLAATAGSAPGAAAAELVPADYDVAADELLLLLLPQPATPATHSSGSTPASQPFEVRIELPCYLKNGSGLRAAVCNKRFARKND
jgi:hypothetical protein